MSTSEPTSSSPNSPEGLGLNPAGLVVERFEARPSKLGEGLTIRRVLPNRQRRMVGAWCFFDHAGPMDYAAGEGLRVGPHPHIGLQTFTWMIEGEIMHRDSLGYEQVIRPGQVNLMTAGSGIVHSEDGVDQQAGRLHAAQLWIALPDAQRNCEPAFANYPELPQVQQDNFAITLLAGTAFGQSSPATIYSPLVGLDFTAQTAASTRMDVQPSFEYAALVLRGAAEVAGEALEPGTLLYLGAGRTSLSISCEAEAQLLLIGGEPFEEDILLWWNLVARTPEEIEQAAEDWNAGRRFGKVKGSPSRPLQAPDSSGLRLKQPKNRKG